MPRVYTGKNLTYIGFPLGGLGAGMFNVEGSGAFSAFSLRNAPNVNLEPCLFSAVTVKGEKNISRVLEGQVPKYKIYGALRLHAVCGDLREGDRRVRSELRPTPVQVVVFFGGLSVRHAPL